LSIERADNGIVACPRETKKFRQEIETALSIKPGHGKPGSAEKTLKQA